MLLSLISFILTCLPTLSRAGSLWLVCWLVLVGASSYSSKLYHVVFIPELVVVSGWLFKSSILLIRSVVALIPTLFYIWSATGSRMMEISERLIVHRKQVLFHCPHSIVKLPITQACVCLPSLERRDEHQRVCGRQTQV